MCSVGGEISKLWYVCRGSVSIKIGVRVGVRVGVDVGVGVGVGLV